VLVFGAINGLKAKGWEAQAIAPFFAKLSAQKHRLLNVLDYFPFA